MSAHVPGMGTGAPKQERGIQMGIDVEFMVRPTEKPTPESFEDLQARFREAFPDPDATSEDRQWPRMEIAGFEDVFTIRVDCLDRYYGIGYERGHWPHIRTIGVWLSENIPGKVRYGGDYADGWDGLFPWPTAVIELDEHWLAVENRPYRERFSR